MSYNTTTKDGLPSRLVNTIASHAGPINALNFSSHPSTYLLTGSSDRQIHLHRVEPTSTSPQPSTQPIQRYLAHGYPILSLTCSLSNETFASAGGDRTGPFLWDVSTAQTLRRFGSSSNQGHTSRITSVIFAGQDDSLLISGSDDRTVRIWDNKSRDTRPIMTLSDAKDGITCLALAGASRSSSHEILTGSVDARLRTYDIRTGKCTTDTLPAPIVSLDVTNDGSAVLIGCMDSRLRLLDRKEGTLLQSFSSPTFQNTGLRIQSSLSSTESMVVVGSESDSKVRAWDVLTGEEVGEIETADHHGEGATKPKPVSSLAFRKGTPKSTGGEIWACGGVDGVVRVYGR